MFSRYGNPSMRRWVRRSARGEMAVESNPATYRGVTGKSVFLVLLTIGVAIVTELLLWFTLYRVSAGEIEPDRLVRLILIGVAIAGVAGVVMLVGSIVLIFHVGAAKFIGPLYSVMQGVFLGTIAGFLNLYVPGVSLAALLGTGIVFAMCLVLYKLLGARISSRFATGLVIAMLSFVLVELICVPIVYFLAAGSNNLTLLLGVQAGLALFCVVFATITVFWDIQNIDYMVQAGIDREYEWLLAYSLTTSLIYLYMEILELIVRTLALFAVSGRK